MTFQLIYDWTEIDKDILEAYRINRYGVLQAVAAKHGMKPRAICKRVWALRKRGIITTSICRPWTAEDEALLERYYGRRTPAWVAEKLGRTVKGTRIRAAELGLSCHHTHYNPSQVAEAVGCHAKQVSRWVEQGLLRAIPKDPHITGSQRRYYITDEALEDFFTAHRQVLERYPMPGRAWIGSFVKAEAAA